MTIFDATMRLLERAMDLRAARHRVIASNIANEETPGYRAKELDFGDLLRAANRPTATPALRITHARHLGPGGPAGDRLQGRLTEMPANEVPLDGNSVNLELELAKLSDNALKFNSAAAIVSIRYRQLLSAIRDAR